MLEKLLEPSLIGLVVALGGALAACQVAEVNEAVPVTPSPTMARHAVPLSQGVPALAMPAAPLDETAITPKESVGAAADY